jgi:acetyltransferase-like isoleucine patch superfamily enzyme
MGEPMDVADLTGAWDYSTLPPNVRVGSGCYIERRGSFDRFRSRCDPGLILGKNVRSYTWTEFNVEPNGTVEIGDDCILVGALFMCQRHISLGRRVVASYHVTIADSDFHPHNPELRRLDTIALSPEGDKATRPPFEARPILIEDDVTLGIGAIILKGSHIGRGAQIGAGSVVTGEIPAGARVAGNPGRVIAS